MAASAELAFARSIWMNTIADNGDPCFFNVLTGEVRWELDKGSLVIPRSNQGEWFELVDPGSQQSYFVNTVTRHTTWSRPDDSLVVPMTAVQRRNYMSESTGPLPKSKQSQGSSQRKAKGKHAELSLGSRVANSHHVARHASSTENRAHHASSPKHSDKLSQSHPPLTPSSLKSPFRFFQKASSSKSSLSDQSPSRPKIQLVPSSRTTLAPSLSSKGKPLTTRLSTGTHHVLPDTLQAELANFSFEGYAHQHFQQRKRGVFRRKVPMTALAAWQPESLVGSLLPLPRICQADAIKTFHLIQQIMEQDAASGEDDMLAALQKAWSASTIDHAYTLVDLGVRKAELRDEIYLQLFKQLTKNPSKASLVKGWQLMQVLLIAFPPSKDLESYLQSLLTEASQNADSPITATVSRYCLSQLYAICERGARGRAPSRMEIQGQTLAAFNPNCFGATLEEVMSLQDGLDFQLPACMVWMANAILSLGGLKTAGIFRIPADVELVAELRAKMNQGIYELAHDDDVHVAASLFKVFFRELKAPLIPFALYFDCLKASKDIVRLHEIIANLPTLRRRVLAFLITFLQMFVKPEVAQVSKMDSSNLAMIWGPNILRGQSSTLDAAYANAQQEQQVVKTLIDLFSPQAVDLGNFDLLHHPTPLPQCERFVKPCSFQGTPLTAR